jgi:hypothetical protein
MNSPKINLNHKNLYKSPVPVANRAPMNDVQMENQGSPSWRDAYKKRCFDEFKKSRQKLMNKFRNFQVTRVNQNFSK